MVDTDRLAKLIADKCPEEGSHATKIDGLFLTPFSTAEVPRNTLHRAVFCVVAQGLKCTLLNGQRFVYDRNKYLLVSLDLPLVGQIEQASRAKPFLGVSLVLDFDEIGALMREADLPCETSPPLRSGLTIGSMDDDLLDAVTRLGELLRKPEQISVLSPLIRREIFYRLLLSERVVCCVVWLLIMASSSAWRLVSHGCGATLPGRYAWKSWRARCG